MPNLSKVSNRIDLPLSWSTDVVVCQTAQAEGCPDYGLFRDCTITQVAHVDNSAGLALSRSAPPYSLDQSSSAERGGAYGTIYIFCARAAVLPKSVGLMVSHWFYKADFGCKRLEIRLREFLTSLMCNAC
ncbi:hypothetical protein BaRGS_00029301 [Batillaria attramentaria]|uniref:Uncharacterized protein n=1 Tax=Batillaria attramentaria TaxID=370345 RepID=A0ABD0JY42_9CAEN